MIVALGFSLWSDSNPIYASLQCLLLIELPLVLVSHIANSMHALPTTWESWDGMGNWINYKSFPHPRPLQVQHGDSRSTSLSHIGKAVTCLESRFGGHMMQQKPLKSMLMRSSSASTHLFRSSFPFLEKRIFLRRQRALGTWVDHSLWWWREEDECEGTPHLQDCVLLGSGHAIISGLHREHFWERQVDFRKQHSLVKREQVQESTGSRFVSALPWPQSPNHTDKF